jgi:hypothetical protein
MLFFVTRELNVLIEAPTEGIQGTDWWAVMAADASDAIATVRNVTTKYVPTPKTKLEKVMEYIFKEESNEEEEVYGGDAPSSEVFLKTAIVAYLSGLI